MFPQIALIDNQQKLLSDYYSIFKAVTYFIYFFKIITQRLIFFQKICVQILSLNIYLTQYQKSNLKKIIIKDKSINYFIAIRDYLQKQQILQTYFTLYLFLNIKYVFSYIIVLKRIKSQILQCLQSLKMKAETISKVPSKSLTKQSNSISKATKKNTTLNKSVQKTPPPATQIAQNSITKDNFDIMHKKFNITQIEPLQIKYVLKCIEGLYKGRFLYITTHKQGQIIGSGNAKQEGLTLQIQGVGLASKHAKLKFTGFKKFYVKDYNSLNGTWLKVPKQGIDIHHNDSFMLGNWNVLFHLSNPLNQIEQICSMYECDELSDILQYNKITNLPQLFRASYEKFKKFPFTNEQITLLNKICQQSKNWYDQANGNKIINMYYLNEEIKGFSQQIGWVTKYIYQNINQTLMNGSKVNEYLAEISKGKLIPKTRVFSKIQPQKNYQLSLHDQIRMGDLTFQLTRFNKAAGESIGGRQLMQDCIIVQEDVGGSQWKLISLFAVVDGYGGSQCMNYIKQNLVKKVREWTHILDQAGDLNQVIRLLMAKTFYQLDYQFYQKYRDIADACGATILCMIIIDSKIYVFNLGDNKGFVYRDQTVYKLSIDHIPGRVDEKARIQQAGGFIQYNRLNGKCTLSRALGQFQYKNIQDYKNNMKGKLKSYLSCIPQVICFDIDVNNDQFIFLSTDGILDVLNTKQVIDYIMERAINLDKQQNPDKIINSLIETCKITNQNCDNMSAILIFLRKGKIGNKISF